MSELERTTPSAGGAATRTPRNGSARPDRRREHRPDDSDGPGSRGDPPPRAVGGVPNRGDPNGGGR